MEDKSRYNAFVANVHNPCSFDIDIEGFDMGSDIVTGTKYCYHEVDMDTMTVVRECESLAYPSRIGGVCVTDKSSSYYRIASRDLRNLFAKNNFNVEVVYKSVDHHGRLILDITCNDVNIRDYLVSNYPMAFSYYNTSKRKTENRTTNRKYSTRKYHYKRSPR